MTCIFFTVLWLLTCDRPVPVTNMRSKVLSSAFIVSVIINGIVLYEACLLFKGRH